MRRNEKLFAVEVVGKVKVLSDGTTFRAFLTFEKLKTISLAQTSTEEGKGPFTFQDAILTTLCTRLGCTYVHL